MRVRGPCVNFPKGTYVFFGGCIASLLCDWIRAWLPQVIPRLGHGLDGVVVDGQLGHGPVLNRSVGDPHLAQHDCAPQGYPLTRSQGHFTATWVLIKLKS